MNYFFFYLYHLQYEIMKLSIEDFIFAVFNMPLLLVISNLLLQNKFFFDLILPQGPLNLIYLVYQMCQSAFELEKQKEAKKMESSLEAKEELRPARNPS